jgi:GH43 family beta-xylosidase
MLTRPTAALLVGLLLLGTGCWKGDALQAPDAGADSADAADPADAGDAAVLDPDAGVEAPDAASLPESAYHVPLVLPGSSEDAADPHCIFEDGTWYLYITSNQVNLEVWTSTDLLTWSYGGVVWQPTAGSWNDVSEAGAFGAWAPSVHKGDDGLFYLYYTAALRIGVARAAPPLGPFIDVFDHPLVGDGFAGIGDSILTGNGRTDFLADYEEFAIDAFVLRRSTGELYLYTVRYTPLSVIVAWPMTDMVTLASNTPTVVLEPDYSSWEGAIVEGPFVEERGGRILLSYSGNSYWTANYGVGAAVADRPLGKFTKYEGNPVLATGSAPGIFGPGHHSLVEGPGGTTLIFYHAKATATNGGNRQIRFGPVVFGVDTPMEVLFPGSP